MTSRIELYRDGAPPLRPTPERHRHDAITVPERDREHQQDRPARVETQTKIDRYEHSKNITSDQATAARRYFADAYRAGMVPAPSQVRYDRVDGARAETSDTAASAAGRRDNAIRALGGLVAIVEFVVIEDLTAGQWAKAHGEHPAAGIAILRLGLTALAKHYGIAK
jgi:hypothetical protein